ncbi:MAG: hypothetical protein M9897_02810 [Brumimicrobium sp.]|nr:hypothetical protein [Brumimicrobium sp.]
MIQIQEKYLLEAINKLNTISEEEAMQVSEKHTLSQEALMGYIFASVIESENEELGEYLVYYFNLFLETCSLQGVKLNTIDEAMIDTFQEEYIPALDEFMETDDEDLIAAICNQPVLLSFIAQEIQATDEEGQLFSDEMATQVFVMSVAMIGLINKAIIKAEA